METQSSVPKELSLDENHVCPLCMKEFAEEKDLLEHNNEKHLKIFKCKICEKIFKSKYSLKRHMNTHKGDKPFICSKCKKGLSSKQSMRRHEEKCNPTNPSSDSVGQAECVGQNSE